jgi:putative membrane protein
MQFRMTIAAALVAAAATLTACSGERNGTPITETTDTAASASETSTMAANNTAATGGTVSNLSEQDKEFVANAGAGGLAEVQMGNLALQKATSADVKAFAQRMVTDHSKANDELSQLATMKGLALPTELKPEQKSAMDHLSSLSGAEFDKAYMDHMVSDHEKDVAEFEKAAAEAQDPDIRGWAGKTAPTLREHLNLAKEVDGKMK